VATFFGVATSLGLGVQQVNAGLDYLLGIGQSPMIQVILIGCITAVATWSVIKGLDKGIRRLSEINITFAALLALFVLLLVPTFITFLWITIFGNTALYIEMFGAGGIARAVQENIPVSLFVLLGNFPLAVVTQGLTIVVVITFFVTSSDSGSMVIDMITSGGNPNPPVLSRLFWAILEGAVAAALLAKTFCRRKLW
jgi:choline-glycine betaine transporter